jgi:hypothetical protein
MESNEVQVLRVHHIDADEKEDRRVTIAPMNVAALVAHEEDTIVRGRSVREISIMFLDGGNISIAVNHSDLELLETTIGAYSFV